MSRRLVLCAIAALLAGGGCYHDETTAVPSSISLARVLLTDAPFPYDSVASVNVFIVRIEASAGSDTTGGGHWVLIAAPRQTFNLLALQQGATAVVGQGDLPAGAYHAVRLTIDTARSAIVWNNGTRAHVNWRSYSASTELPLYALVEYPVDVPMTGAEIVIDFDVGRSFWYNYYGTNEFTLIAQLRAINAAATGAITGAVTSGYTGVMRPMKDASITVCRSGPCDPPGAGYVVATGRSDSAGQYKVAFLRAAIYTVRVEQGDYPFLAPVITQNVTVAAGATTPLSISLPGAGSGGSYLHISGPTSVGVGGAITLRAAVGDATGHPVPSPSVTWSSGDTLVAHVSGVSDSAGVAGRRPGSAIITARSGGLSDSLTIQVVGAPAPVAAVAVAPDSASVTVGDSSAFLAVLRDSAGTQLSGRAVSWFTSDTGVITLYPYGSSALVRARAAGSAVLGASSEGKTGEARITVHLRL
jgi:hypothetical protein